MMNQLKEANTIEITDTSNLVKKNDYNTNFSEIEKKNT